MRELTLRSGFQHMSPNGFGIVTGYYGYGSDPQTAFNELFRAVTNPGAVDSDNAMLAFLQNEESFKEQILPGYEKQKLSSHIHSIDAIRSRNT